MRHSKLLGGILCWPLLTLTLVGCEERHPELYPDLHSVPDRPTNTPAPSRVEEEVSAMGHDQQGKMEKNKALRDVFHLETSVEEPRLKG